MNFNTENEDSILQVYRSKGYRYLRKSACYTLRDEMQQPVHQNKKMKLNQKMKWLCKVMQGRRSKVKGHNNIQKKSKRTAASWSHERSKSAFLWVNLSILADIQAALSVKRFLHDYNCYSHD